MTFSQVDYVVNLRGLQTFFTHFQDDVAAMYRRVDEHMHEKIAVIILVRHALACFVLRDPIEP
jgi:hypothetical protein